MKRWPASRRLRPVIVAAVVGALAASASANAVAAAPSPRASLTQVENQLMCVVCREPLAVAQSPEADQERQLIRTLIAQGDTTSQIEQAMVANYGPAVLAKPPAHGFNLTVYILPPAILVAGLLILALTLPRWRRRARERAGTTNAPIRSLSAADARRLDEDLAQY